MIHSVIIQIGKKACIKTEIISVTLFSMLMNHPTQIEQSLREKEEAKFYAVY